MQYFAPSPTFRRFAAVLFACLTALAAGCNSEGSAQPPAGQAPPPSEVVVRTVAQADIPLTMEYMGQVAGSREVEVRARVGGILLKRSYTEGAQVRQGDVMFEIDPEPSKAALEQAQGALGQSEARLQKARRDLDRMSRLVKDGMVSRKDADDAKTEYESASADVRAAQAKVKEARINLGYTRVEAPVTGMTSKETRSEGSLVTLSADGSLLTTITRVDPVYVNFSIPGSESTRFRKARAEGRIDFEQDGNFTVSVLLPDGTPYSHPGRINFMDSQVDGPTGVVKARAEVPNPGGEILPGQFVRVKLKGARLLQALAIPQRAVLRTEQGTMVWVVDGAGVVAPRPVTLGETLDNNYLVEQGLKNGDRVIVEGIIKVRPGATVRPKEEIPAVASATADKPAQGGQAGAGQ